MEIVKRDHDRTTRSIASDAAARPRLSPSRRGVLTAGLLGAGGLLLPWRLLPSASASDDPYAVVRGNWFAYVTGTPFDSSMPSIKTAVASLGSSAQQYASTMETSAGRTELWTDLPLGTSSASARTSFNRLKQMALAYATPGTVCTGDAGVLAKVLDGVEFLLAGTYTTALPPRGYDNWWDWQIGIPHALEDTAILIFGALTSDQVSTWCDRIDHFVTADTVAAGTGANLLNWCRILVVNGALRASSDKIGQGITALSPALVESLTGDGMYEDGSFLQHTAHVAYVDGYGETFYDTVSALTRALSGSQWTITDPNIANIYNGVDRGLIPSVWEGLAVDSMRGRNIARITSSDADTGLAVANTVLRYAEGAPSTQQAARWKSVAKGWLQSTPASLSGSSAATIDLIARCERVLNDTTVTSAPEPDGLKIYYENDRALHRRPGWAFGVSACSARIARYECVNNENLHGWHTGDGMTSLYLESDRTQFDDAFWNTVDAYRLPGTTVDTAALADAAGANTSPTTTWAGGAVTPNSFGAGRYGAFGQDLQAFGSDLTAKKSWFFLDDCVVALGAGISGSSQATVETVVENRNLHAGGSTALTVDGALQPGTTGWSGSFAKPGWAHIEGVAGYVFLGGGASLIASRADRTGSWFDIDPYLGDTTTDTRPYLTLSLNHGAHPSNTTYAYAVLPNATAAQTANRSSTPGIALLANSAAAQGINQPSTGLTMVNFFAAGTAGPVTASGPAAVVIDHSGNNLAVSVADPTRGQATVTVTLGRSFGCCYQAPAEDDGITLLSSDTNGTTLLVEVGGAHGASRTIGLVTGQAPNPRTAMALPPVADTFVRDGTYAGDNYGGSSELDVKKSGSGTGNTGYSRRTLLAFDTSAVSGTVRRAVLWLNGRTNDSGSLQTQLQAFACASGWSELGVDWNNAPPMTQALGTGKISAAQDWVGLDVTPAFTSPVAATTAICVWQPSGVPGLLTQLRSRESGADAPKLEIVCDK